MRFSNLIRCYQTSKVYPDINDDRMVIHYGYFIDPENIVAFFSELKNGEDISKSAHSLETHEFLEYAPRSCRLFEIFPTKWCGRKFEILILRLCLT